MRKTATFTWFDDDTTDTAYLAMKAYGLTILGKNETSNDNELEIYVEGAPEDIARFREDLEDGEVLPMSKARDLDDDEYDVWLATELAAIGLEYTPNRSKMA